jgi:hypothetical protein
MMGFDQMEPLKQRDKVAQILKSLEVFFPKRRLSFLPGAWLMTHGRIMPQRREDV